MRRCPLKIGIIGSGNIGGTLARLLAGAGHEVVPANAAGSSELLAAALPGAKVVKAFNTIHYRQPAGDGLPSGTPGRRAVPIAGDDSPAKATVARLMDEVGFDAYDVGSLPAGRRFDPGTPLFDVALTSDEVAATLA